MTLSDINVNSIKDQDYIFIAKINDKNILYRPWNTKDEKNYLIETESGESISNERIFDILIRPCLKDKNIKLDSLEQVLLMVEIRKKSIGDTFNIQFVCPECKKPNEVDISFDNIVKYKAFDKKEVKLQDNLCVAFKEITSQGLKDRIENATSKTEKAFVELVSSIEYIISDDTKIDVFTFDEIYSFIENLPSGTFDILMKEYNDSKGTLEFKASPRCMFCDKENHIDLEEIPNFLWA